MGCPQIFHCQHRHPKQSAEFRDQLIWRKAAGFFQNLHYRNAPHRRLAARFAKTMHINRQRGRR
jgi:hypothetical protein